MRNIHFAIALFSLLLSLGCNQIIEIDLPEHKPQLVVNVAFNTDSTWKARVSLSQSIQTASEPVGVPSATVLIEDNGLVVDTLIHAQGDTFLSIADRKPVIGHTYTIRASAPGYTSVTGTETAPIPVLPTAAEFRDSVFVDQWGQVKGELRIGLDDPAGTHNYYMISTYSLDTFIYGLDTIISWNPAYGESQEPDVQYNFAASSFLIDDVNFDGLHREFKLQFYTYQSAPEINSKHYYVLSTVTESFYLYMKTFADYGQASGNPFAEPVRLYSNMTGGMGVFSGFSPVVVLVR